MRGGFRRRTTSALNVSIPVQATGTGALGANPFTGWTGAAGGSIFTWSSWGVTGGKYLGAPNETSIYLRSRAVSFDQEVTFWVSVGRVYLRLTDAGEALMFDTNINAGGGWSVSYVPSVATGTYFDSPIILGGGTPVGLNPSNTATDTYTFGVSGFYCYVKWNGVEQWRAPQIYHYKPGRIGLRTFPGGAYGFRSFDAVFNTTAALQGSSPSDSLINVRDIGLKALETTGSMTAGSATLTVASNPGFAIGDPICVVIGGEAGAGTPTTRGVGGQWPALTYANSTARLADTSQAAGKLAAQLDNGLVYQWTGAAWRAYDTSVSTSNPWHYRMLPKSLITTITNISGTTFTLADTAVVSTTSAQVVYNCSPAIDLTMGYNYAADGTQGYVSGRTFEFPAGNFYACKYNLQTQMIQGANWTLKGAGRDSTYFISPMGTTGLRIAPEYQSNLVLQDMTLKGNRRGDKGWLWIYDGNDVPSSLVPNWLNIINCNNTTAQRLRVMNMDFSLSGSHYSLMNDIIARWEIGQRAYTGWQVQISNCISSTGSNIVIDNDAIVPSLEIFGGTGNTFENVTITNGLMATNVSDNWTFRNITATLQTNAANDAVYGWVTVNAPLFNINTNIDGGAVVHGPGLLDGFNFTINYANAANYLFQGININGNNDNITIRGAYPAKPNTNGLITFPAGWSSSAKGIVAGSDGPDNLIIEGVRITPPNSGVFGEIFCYAPGSIIRNCVVDVIDSNATRSNNITNAAYDALP